MPWCPKCKNEYVSGITTCADCGVELVESLKEDLTAIYFGKEAEILPIFEFIKSQGVNSIAMEASEDEAGIYELRVSKTDAEQAKKLMYVLLKEKTKEAYEDMQEEPTEEEQETSCVYIDSKERAEENQSSAMALILVGVVGGIFDLLFFFGVLPIHMNLTGKYLTSGVMGVLFILFIIMGIMSLKSSKVWKEKAGKEDNLNQEIHKWFFDNFNREALEREVSAEAGMNEALEEMLYFEREKIIRNHIKDNFVGLNEGFLSNIIEEIYSEIYGED